MRLNSICDDHDLDDTSYERNVHNEYVRFNRDRASVLCLVNILQHIIKYAFSHPRKVSLRRNIRISVRTLNA
jgi:hypothetical protein